MKEKIMALINRLMNYKSTTDGTTGMLIFLVSVCGQGLAVYINGVIVACWMLFKYWQKDK